MDERHDPMALWVGTWTPQDAIDVETTRLREDRAPRKESRDTAEPDAK